METVNSKRYSGLLHTFLRQILDELDIMFGFSKVVLQPTRLEA